MWTLAVGLTVGVAVSGEPSERFRSPGLSSMSFLCTAPLPGTALDTVRTRLGAEGFDVTTTLPPLEALEGPVALVKPLDPGFVGPDADFLQYKGRGLEAADVEALQGEQTGFWIATIAPTPHQDTVVRQTGALAAELASTCGAYLWDEETREVFDRQAWEDRRVDRVAEDPGLSVTNHMVMHSYQDGELLRVITLGMAKFGLPDLVVEDVPRRLSSSTASLVNLAAQTLLERGGLDEPLLALDVATIRHEGLRTMLSSDWAAGATGQLQVRLFNATAEDGDPDNALLGIDFEGVPGESFTERLDGALSSLFGSEDTIQMVDQHDKRLQALQAEALLLIGTSVKDRFRAGLPLGAQLMVKGGFDTASGGTEWMWVEVTRWRGRKVIGILANDPHDVPGLRSGARVKLKEQELFDYLFMFDDGTTEGNATGAYIQRLQGK